MNAVASPCWLFLEPLLPFVKTTSWRPTWFEKSFLIWLVKGKQQGVCICGWATTENNLWCTLPDFVHQSGIIPDFHDYYSNFTMELFEKLFAKLCKTLANEYGVNHIHMDGVRYHVCKVDLQLTLSMFVTNIHAWLQRKGIAVPAWRTPHQ